MKSRETERVEVVVAQCLLNRRVSGRAHSIGLLSLEVPLLIRLRLMPIGTRSQIAFGIWRFTSSIGSV